VAAADWSERALRFRYASRTALGERQVDPLGIVLKGGAWYLVAGVKGETKTFRIARMSDVTLLEKTCDYPKSFDLADHWAESIRRYEVDLHPNKATIRVSPAGLAMLDDLLPPYIRSGAVISPEPDRDGWRQVTIAVGSLDHAAAEMLRFGTHAEVLEPPELRAKMTEIIASLAKMYRSSAKPEG
jgi:predicted DNA-binding transcriptional regulator YafY